MPTGAAAYARVGGARSAFPVKSGMRRRCPMLLLNFDIFIDTVVCTLLATLLDNGDVSVGYHHPHAKLSSTHGQ
eukprot:358514-Chlamydomonas_euryale.AAC.12